MNNALNTRVQYKTIYNKASDKNTEYPPVLYEVLFRHIVVHNVKINRL